MGTLDAMTESIPITSLLRTFQETVVVVWELGIPLQTSRQKQSPTATQACSYGEKVSLQGVISPTDYALQIRQVKITCLSRLHTVTRLKTVLSGNTGRLFKSAS
ncbi:hypothetical protein ABVK25_010202 [Lepraria finkii]|uniref:Uncharacterized protein n=1 Tax=Lepraria finkii TaxID=1340010 RepID=A0ABR4AW43_9LECA